GRCFVGVSQVFKSQANNLNLVMDAMGYLRIDFREPRTLSDAITLMYQIEQLFSLLCFSYMKCKDSQVKVQFSDYTATSLTVECAPLIPNAKVEIDRRELSLRLNSVSLGEVIGNFLDIYDDIEQTLNWYRIVQAEERYLEDTYFYCVRMLESLYRNLK